MGFGRFGSTRKAFVASLVVLVRINCCHGFNIFHKVDGLASDDPQKLESHVRPRWLRRRTQSSGTLIEVDSLSQEEEQALAFGEEESRVLQFMSMSASMPTGPPTPTETTPMPTTQPVPTPTVASPDPTPSPTENEQCSIALGTTCITQDNGEACEDAIAPAAPIECLETPSRLCFRYTQNNCDPTLVGMDGLVGCMNMGMLGELMQLVILNEAGTQVYVDTTVRVDDVVCVEDSPDEFPSRIVIQTLDPNDGTQVQIVFVDTTCEQGGLTLLAQYGSVDLVSYTNAAAGDVDCLVPVFYDYIVVNRGPEELTITAFERILNGNTLNILPEIPVDDRNLVTGQLLTMREAGTVDTCVDTSIDIRASVDGQGGVGTPACSDNDEYTLMFDAATPFPTPAPTTFEQCQLELDIRCATDDTSSQCEQNITREEALACLDTPTRLCFVYTENECGPFPMDGLLDCTESGNLQEVAQVTCQDQTQETTFVDEVVRTGDEFCIAGDGNVIPDVLVCEIETSDGVASQSITIDSSCEQGGLTLLSDYGSLQLVGYSNAQEDDVDCLVPVTYDYEVVNSGGVDLTLSLFERMFNGVSFNILPNLSPDVAQMSPMESLVYSEIGLINRCEDTVVDIEAAVAGSGPQVGASDCDATDSYLFTFADNGAIRATSSPTMPPTPGGEMLCGMPTTMRREELFADVSSISSPELVNQVGSPQNDAFNWLVDDDPSQVCPNEDLVVTQRYVMAVLYYGTEGDSWLSCNDPSLPTPAPCGSESGRFLSNSSVCGWIENECDVGTGELIMLGVDENSLNGSIPSELAALSGLRDIDMDENKLNMNIPTEIFMIPTLSNLDLDRNLLVGSIPEELYSASLLNIIDMNSNMLTGSIQTEIGLLQELVSLVLDDNEMEGTIPTEIGLLSKLEYFLFDNNSNVTGSIPTQLGDMPAATMLRLDLHENFLSGKIPSQLGNMTQMTRLSLWDNELTGDIPSELGLLENAEQILLHYNNLTGVVPAELCVWASLPGNVLTVDCSDEDPKVTCPADCGCTCVPPLGSRTRVRRDYGDLNGNRG